MQEKYLSSRCQVWILWWRKHRRKEKNSLCSYPLLCAAEGPCQLPSGSAEPLEWDLLLPRCQKVPVAQLCVVTHATPLHDGAGDQRAATGSCNTFLMNWQTRAKHQLKWEWIHVRKAPCFLTYPFLSSAFANSQHECNQTVLGNIWAAYLPLRTFWVVKFPHCLFRVKCSAGSLITFCK